MLLYCDSLLHFHCVLTIGITITANEDPLTVGQRATITCTTDTESSNIQWLFNGVAVVEAVNTDQLDLEFNPVNDNIHNRVYTCSATINGVQHESSIIAIVDGEH